MINDADFWQCCIIIDAKSSLFRIKDAKFMRMNYLHNGVAKSSLSTTFSPCTLSFDHNFGGQTCFA